MKTKNKEQKIEVMTNLTKLKSARRIAVFKAIGIFMADVSNRPM